MIVEIERIEGVPLPDIQEQRIGHEHDHSMCGSECGEFQSEIHVDSHIEGLCNCGDCTNNEAELHVDVHVHSAECAKLPGHGAVNEVDRVDNEHEGSGLFAKKENLSQLTINEIPERIRREVELLAEPLEVASEVKSNTKINKKDILTKVEREGDDTTSVDNQVETVRVDHPNNMNARESIIGHEETVKSGQATTETALEALVEMPIEVTESESISLAELVVEEDIENEPLIMTKIEVPRIDISESVYSMAVEIEDTIGRLVLPSIEPDITLSSTENDQMSEEFLGNETDPIEALILSVSSIVAEQYSLLIEDPEFDDIEALESVMLSIRKSINIVKETKEITPKLHSDIIRLMDLLGFEDAEKSLQSYISKYGINFLGDLFAKYFEILNQKGSKKESMSQIPFQARQNRSSLGLGRVVLALLGFKRASFSVSNNR